MSAFSTVRRSPTGTTTKSGCSFANNSDFFNYLRIIFNSIFLEQFNYGVKKKDRMISKYRSNYDKK